MNSSGVYFDGNPFLPIKTSLEQTETHPLAASPMSVEITTDGSGCRNRNASSSLSSGPMPESEVAVDFMEGAILEVVSWFVFRLAFSRSSIYFLFVSCPRLSNVSICKLILIQIAACRCFFS